MGKPQSWNTEMQTFKNEVRQIAVSTTSETLADQVLKEKAVGITCSLWLKHFYIQQLTSLDPLMSL